MSEIDQAAVAGELSAELGDAADRETIEAIVADWAREADPTPNPDAVLRFQREDLETRLAGTEGAARGAALRAHLLGRRADRVNALAFALGKQVLSGDVDDETARSRGEELRGQADALAGELAALEGAPGLDAIHRKLGEAAMDALYAIERKAMSPRLAREGGAPNLF